MLVYIFGLLGLLFVALYFFSRKSSPLSSKSSIKLQEQASKKPQRGQIQILYASQTGTAAKMASTFAQEAAEYGFTGVVINLKQLTHNEFKKNQISVYFVANTGEGDPPQNSVQFMKMLNGKVQLQGETPNWTNVNYAIFGLGDTQYEHFNKTGIDIDKGLQKLGATRISQICLGDANSSIQDDYNEWKNQLWPLLIAFREQNPYEGQHEAKEMVEHVVQDTDVKYISDTLPTFANYRFCFSTKKGKKVIEDELDFKTKASLSGRFSNIQKIEQKRQDNEGGSSLQIEVHLQGHPHYETASNIAIWAQNDPKVVNEVLKYFGLSHETQIDVQIINKQKNTKFNFVAPLTIGKLLEEYIDLQFKVTKGMLKKLAKFQSNDSAYFLDNSSPKTTQEFKRLTETQGQFNYLFKLVQRYEVRLGFEDFIELSDSMGPRLFTIASSYKAQKNVVIIASLVQNGLISKHFLRNPTSMKAQLRKSTFTPLQKWKKAIFIGAGTGFAPFRGYLQQKQLAVKQNKPYPKITLYFGCRKSNSDFIYKQDIKRWEKQGIIDKLHVALSRETEYKIYVQTLLEQQKQQLNQYLNDPETTMLICGSLAMGRDVVEVLEKSSGKTPEEFKKQMTQWEKSGKLIKQLW